VRAVPFAWRMDASWRTLREGGHAAWRKRFQYLREHFWVRSRWNVASAKKGPSTSSGQFEFLRPGALDVLLRLPALGLRRSRLRGHLLVHLDREVSTSVRTRRSVRHTQPGTGILPSNPAGVNWPHAILRGGVRDYCFVLAHARKTFPGILYSQSDLIETFASYQA